MKSHSNADGRQSVGHVIADRIRMARRSARLSQAELAERLNVASSAVAQWEGPRGTTPRIEKLPVIAAALGVSVEWLLTGREERHHARNGDGHTPALTPDAFARDCDEEMVLRQFRRLPARTRGLFLGLLNEFGSRRGEKSL